MQILQFLHGLSKLEIFLVIIYFLHSIIIYEEIFLIIIPSNKIQLQNIFQGQEE